MSTTITFHGVACFEVVSPAGRILFDPFLRGNPVATVTPDSIVPPDLMLVSHAPFDHFGDAVEIALATNCAVVCAVDCARLLEANGVPREQIVSTVWGVDVAVNGYRVRPVESRHWSSASLPDGSIMSGPPLGFVVEVEPGVTIYHCGDSALFDGMSLIKRFYQPTVGLLGCAQPPSLAPKGIAKYLTGEMTPEQAAYAAELLGVRFAVAAHYESPEQPEIEEFIARVAEFDSSGNRVPVALSSGQSLIIDGGGARVA